MPKTPPIQRNSSQFFKKVEEGGSLIQNPDGLPARVANDEKMKAIEQEWKENHILPPDSSRPIEYDLYLPARHEEPEKKKKINANNLYQKHKDEYPVFRLPSETHEYIRKVSSDIQVIQGEVLAAFLMFALEDYHSGKKVLPEGEPKSYTLFSKNGWGIKTLSINRSGSQNPQARVLPGRKKSKVNGVKKTTKTVRYYGVPNNVIEEVKEIAEKTGYPFWAVSDLFIRYSITLYEAEEFNLDPRPRTK